MTATGNVVDFVEALRIVAQQAASSGVAGVETVALLEAAGRVLAADVVADRDQPGFDRSTRDGFAVRAGELCDGGRLTIAGQVRAGERWQGPALGAGAAIEIMTGAPMPGGADAVVMVEHVERREGTICVAAGRALAAGENIVRRGSEALAGAVLLPAGTPVGAAEIALAAACGQSTLAVYRRPVVAIVATGDELVELDAAMRPEQIRNSNSYAIAAMVAAAGGRAVRLPVARDTRDDVRARVAEGRKADLLIFSGGVSMGEYDLVEEVLAKAGAEFFFTGVRMQPGKPVVFGRLPARDGAAACAFFGLPGNPISTQVTFHCFVEPLLRAQAGAAWAGPRFAQATMAVAVEGKPGVTRLLPARMDGVSVRVVAWQGSGDLAANARANCYAELLPGRAYGAGEVIRVLLR